MNDATRDETTLWRPDGTKIAVPMTTRAALKATERTRRHTGLKVAPPEGTAESQEGQAEEEEEGKGGGDDAA